MSEYGFRKIRPEIHLDAAPRNTLNPASGPNSDTLEQQTVAMLTSGCVSADGGREVPDYRSTFSAEQRFLEGIQSSKCGSIRIATTFLSGTVVSDLLGLK